MARRVDVVPHTHWDREWYSSFPTFRLRLIDLLDEFLPLLETDPSYRHFLLDGQMAVVDDYLEVRPEAEPTLQRLAASGRLAMGPWYILSDEFLVSGETLIRNLQMGLARAADFGGAMEVGYLPDMFGHIAQMPQLLRLAGLDHAVVWRGVPSSVTTTGFWWESPDGSRVRATYLPAGYGNGAAIPNDPAALVDRIASHDAELGDRLVDGAAMLWMNGTDHQVPQRWLGSVIDAADAATDDFDIAIGSLADHVAGQPDPPDTVVGELRSGARANLLMGVTSNRVDIRQAAARAEQTLERLAEPLAALFLPADRWPGRMLELAWLEMVRNSAHDSVCACSADEVVDAVAVRYSQALDIAAGLAHRAAGALADDMADDGWYAINPAARSRAGIVEVTVEGDDVPAGAQLTAAIDGFEIDMSVPGRDLGPFLGMLRSQQLTDDTYVNRIDVTEHDDRVEIALDLDTKMVDSLNVEEVKRSLYALAGARPDTPFVVKGRQQPARRVLVHVPEVPGFGWAPVTPGDLTVTPVTVDRPAGHALAPDETVTVTNGRLSLAVSGADGTWSLDGTAGLDRLVDGGDHGDTYNYSPPAHDNEVSAPTSTEVTVVEVGPVLARVEVRRTYRWPERIVDGEDGGARVGEVDGVVTTTLEVSAGERFVRVATTIDNQARDHRLRTHLPLPRRADGSTAECAFTVVERGLDAEGGPTEHGLPTFPARRFFRAGGLAVAHEGVAEYEVVADGTEVAMTLLRCTGMLSRTEMAYRPLPAGPDMALEGPQMIGRHTARWAVSADPDVDPYEMADDAFLFLMPIRSDGGGSRPDTGSELTVTGAEVSAVRRRDAALEVRVFNPRSESATVAIPGRHGHVVDLRDRPIEPFEGSAPLAPHQILTIHLD